MTAAAEPAAKPPQYCHATAIVVNGRGIVIRGRSRAGKSSLALDVLRRARELGVAAYLVGDDRVMLTRQDNDVVVQGHPAIAGRIEERGTGIITMPYQTLAVVRLVVDLAGPTRVAAGTCGITPHVTISDGTCLPIGTSVVSHLYFERDVSLGERTERILRSTTVAD